MRVEMDQIKFTLRDMTQDDAPYLAQMEQDIFTDPWSESAYRELFQYSYYIKVVAETNDRIAGCACMTMLGGEGDIDRVMVDAGLRGQGIGSALVQRLLQSGRERGAEEFTLEVRKSNQAAIRLYEKNGFVSEGVRPGFYGKPKEDALIMWIRNRS